MTAQTMVRRAAALFVGGVLAAPALAGDIDAAVATSLAMRPVGAIRVLIHLRDPARTEEAAGALRALPLAQRPGQLAKTLRQRFLPRAEPLIERLRAIGGQDLHALWLVDAVSAEVPRSRIKEIAAWAEVQRLDVDVALRSQQKNAQRSLRRDVTLADATAQAVLDKTAREAPRTLDVSERAAPLALPEHLAWMDLPRAWQAGYSGRGMTVAVIDSGVDLRAQGLAAAWRAGSADWFDPYAQHRLPHDGQGHGTVVASLLVGDKADGAPAGVAPQARFIAARLFDDGGYGHLSAVFRIYQWLLDPDGRPETADAPQVVNNSWGFAQSTDQCDLRFERVWQAFRLVGIPVVFAAGNDGPLPQTSMSPANNPGVISVGALDATGVLARQSSRGPSSCTDVATGQPVPFPSIYAPGVSLPTLDRIGASMGVPNRSDGTSFAAALASGALLLLRQAHPQASVDELLALLERHAQPAEGERAPAIRVGVALVPAGQATRRPAQRIELPLSGGEMQVGAAAVAAALPRGLAVNAIEVAGTPPAGVTPAAGGVRWQPGAAAGATLPLLVALSDGTRLPLVVAPAAAETAPSGAPSHMLASRRDTPLMLELSDLVSGKFEPAAVRWSQPLRGGRIERIGPGALSYRPPKNFVGTDQFALRGGPEGDVVVKVLVRP